MAKTERIMSDESGVLQLLESYWRQLAGLAMIVAAYTRLQLKSAQNRKDNRSTNDKVNEVEERMRRERQEDVERLERTRKEDVERIEGMTKIIQDDVKKLLARH